MDPHRDDDERVIEKRKILVIVILVMTIRVILEVAGRLLSMFHVVT